MSVWTELQQGLSLAIGFEKADELVREARAEHAHELAEKQRADDTRATLARVREVLETEAVVGRTALEYRGLITTALLAHPEVLNSGS